LRGIDSCDTSGGVTPLPIDHLLRARRRRGLVAIFDVDGVLAPIAPSPETAHVPPATRRLLHRLARRDDMLVGVVSGRPLGQVARLVGADGLWLAGLHGAMRRPPGGITRRYWTDEQLRRGRQLARGLRLDVTGLAGVRVEAKGPIVAVHVRGATIRASARAADAVGLRCPPGWEVIVGRRVFELRPRRFPTKGDAVRWIREQRPGVPVLYLGDDTTDEDAFRVLGARDFPVLVDPRAGSAEHPGVDDATHARWGLPDTAAAAELLALLAARD
jgi:trehalose-phosphatase